MVEKKNERKREISGRLDKLLKFPKDNNIMQFCKEEENIYIGKHTYLYIHTFGREGGRTCSDK